MATSTGGKMKTKQDAEYIEFGYYGPRPCKKCRYFKKSAHMAEPNTCARVMGSIASQGHCKLWQEVPGQSGGRSATVAVVPTMVSSR